MGSVNFSIPKQLVQRFIAKAPFNNFIETGTYKGETAFWAARFFPNVYTIEIDGEISNSTAANDQCPQNINFYVGNSKDVLPQIVPNLFGRNFFWLDGHWCFGAGGKESECPLMLELSAIGGLENSVIFIDDARCFLGPLPPPHNADDWPRIDEIFSVLKKLFPGHRTTIIDDVILCYPSEFSEVVDSYWQETFQSRYTYREIADKVSLSAYSKIELVKYIVSDLSLKKVVRRFIPKTVSGKNNVLSSQNVIENNFRWLKDFDIKTIIDIGANEGQFAKKILTIFPDANLHCVEPLPDVYKKLCFNFKDLKNFFGYNVGLGEKEEEREIYNNEYSPSSSLLEMEDLHKTNFEFAVEVKSTQIPIRRLDDLLLGKITVPLLVKIDVQGYELHVLAGGEDTIRQADIIIIEVSFYELYKGQPLFNDIYEYFNKIGFRYMGNIEQLLAPTNQRVLQADAVFINSKKDKVTANIGLIK